VLDISAVQTKVGELRLGLLLLSAARCLRAQGSPPLSPQHAWACALQVLLDLLAAVAEPADLVQRNEGER
jgi:hypothetical protein